MMSGLILTVTTAAVAVFISGAFLLRVRLSLLPHDLAVITISGIVVPGSIGLYALNGRPELQSAHVTVKSGLVALAGGHKFAQTMADGEHAAGLTPGGTSSGIAAGARLIDPLSLRLQMAAFLSDTNPGLSDANPGLSDAEPDDDWNEVQHLRTSEPGRETGADLLAYADRPPAGVVFIGSTGTATDGPAAILRDRVERLAGRLAATPNDADDWIELIHSYKVLGEVMASRAALRSALDVFADGTPEQGLISDAAHALGIYQ